MTSHAQDADAIVIGAGTGGLVAAAYLAALGRHVIVIDRQQMPGGNTAAFAHAGYEFDIGLHYLGGWRGYHPGLKAVLDPLGVDLRWREQDPDGFDEVHFDDMTFRVPRGIEQFRSRLHETFPVQRSAIDRHLRRIATISAELEECVPIRLHTRSLLQTLWHTRVTTATSNVTLGRAFDQLGCSPRLRSVLNWCHLVDGVAPSQISLTMHAASAMHYLAGAWYPEGGGPAVVDALAEVVRGSGGEVLLGSDVERILVDSDGVRGVRLADNADTCAAHELHAPIVISAADLKRTFTDLLAPGDVPPRTLRRVRNYRMAAPLTVVYLVLDRDLRAEGVTNHNWWVHRDDDADGLYAAGERGEFRATCAFITSASLKDPTNPRLCRDGQTNMQVMGMAPSAHGFWGSGDTYARRKQEVRDALLATAEIAIPGLRDSIAYEETASPLTWERYLHNSGGTSYGIAATPGQMLLRRPGPTTHIPGLYLAGANTRTAHGITGVALGGMEAAALAAGLPTWPSVHPTPSRRQTTATAAPSAS